MRIATFHPSKSLSVTNFCKYYPFDFPCYTVTPEAKGQLWRFCQLPCKSILSIFSVTREMIIKWVHGPTVTWNWDRISLITFYLLMCSNNSNKRVMMWCWSLHVLMSIVLKLARYFPFLNVIWGDGHRSLWRRTKQMVTIYPFHDVATFFFKVIMCLL